MSVRVSRASSVIVHHVAPAAVDRFLALQDEFTQAAEKFPGYQGTDVHPPSAPTGTEWVIVIHFADETTLRGWLDSPIRADWVKKVRSEVGEFELKSLPGGFASWFTGVSDDTTARPPGWKMVLTVLLGLYPTVVFLSLTVGKITSPLGAAVALLIGNLLSVSMLQYLIMPILTRVFAPWLRANGPGDWKKSLAGVGVIAALLAGLCLSFRFIMG